jgi:hypothetical protein
LRAKNGNQPTMFTAGFVCFSLSVFGGGKILDVERFFMKRKLRSEIFFFRVPLFLYQQHRAKAKSKTSWIGFVAVK